MMVVNDDAHCLTPRGVFVSIASKPAPTTSPLLMFNHPYQ
ncbi:hypothetical protein PG5_17060 [Pseudomonas sp. G5(2012)]|nr:hypothetical protein PG5_17060 [Pseudomonas sp. G5(2012)]